MDFGAAFSFAFQDQDWLKKLGIAALLLLIPVVGWLFVTGWTIEIIRRVIRHDSVLLPEWNDFGKYFMDGLLMAIAGFIYTLPANLVNGIAQGANAYMQGNGDTSGDMATVIMVVVGCAGCIAFIYSILVGLILPAVYANYAVKGGFGAAFQFGEIFALFKAAPGAFVIAFLGSIVAAIIGTLGVIVCIIGIVATMAYACTIGSHLTGQAYNQAQANLSGSNVPAAMPPMQ